MMRILCYILGHNWGDWEYSEEPHPDDERIVPAFVLSYIHRQFRVER